MSIILPLIMTLIFLENLLFVYQILPTLQSFFYTVNNYLFDIWHLKYIPFCWIEHRTSEIRNTRKMSCYYFIMRYFWRYFRYAKKALLWTVENSEIISIQHYEFIRNCCQMIFRQRNKLEEKKFIKKVEN